MLREFLIRAITQAFLSFFTAGATAVLTVVAVVCLRLALDFLLEGQVFPSPTLWGTTLAVAIVSAKMTLPIWLIGNSMLILSCAMPLFRTRIIWLLGSIIVAVSLSLAMIGGLPDNGKSVVMLFCYTGVASLVFRFFTLRLAIGIWADWRTLGRKRFEPSYDH